MSFTSSLFLYYFVKYVDIGLLSMNFEFDRLEFPQLAPLMCFVLSIAICKGYNNLIDYCYEVMVICFMADEEMFQGDQRFADPKITDYFNQLGEESEKAYMKDIEAYGQEKRGAKDNILKKGGKKGAKGMAKVKADDNEDGNSSEEDDENPEEKDEEERRNRGEEIKKMFEKKKKDQEEKDLANKAAEKDKENGKKAKVELTGDTVAGNLLKMAQRQAIGTTSQEDKVKLLRKKSDED